MFITLIAQLETTVSEFTKLVDKYGAAGTAAILIAVTAFFVVRAATNAYTKQVNANTGQIAILTDSQRQINSAFDAQLKERMAQANRIEELHARYNESQGQLQKLSSEYLIQGSDLREALNDIVDLKADRLTKDTEIKTLQARLTSTEDKLAVAAKSLSDFKEAMQTAEQLSAASLEQANQRYTLEKERNDNLQKVNEQQSQVITDLRGKVETQEHEITGLRERVTKLENEKAVLLKGMAEQPGIAGESDKGLR